MTIERKVNILYVIVLLALLYVVGKECYDKGLSAGIDYAVAQLNSKVSS